MRSNRSSRKFAAACATISLLQCEAAFALPQADPRPAIAVVDPADAAQWEAWGKAANFQVIVAPSSAETADARVQALAAAVAQAVESRAADPARIYLVGRGAATATLFYTISRLPD